jgi:hypothetical protein
MAGLPPAANGPRGKRCPHRLAGTGQRHRAQRCPPAIRQDRASAIGTRQGRDKESAGSVERQRNRARPRRGTPCARGAGHGLRCGLLAIEERATTK